MQTPGSAGSCLMVTAFPEAGPHACKLSPPNLSSRPLGGCPLRSVIGLLLLCARYSRAAVVEFVPSHAPLLKLAQKHQLFPTTPSKRARLSGIPQPVGMRRTLCCDCVSSRSALTPFIRPLQHCHRSSFPTAWTLPWAEDTVTFYIFRFAVGTLRPKCRARP